MVVGNSEFESESKRGLDLERYVFDPATIPELRRWHDEIGGNLKGDFGRIVPRIGERARDRAYALVIRTLHRLGLLRAFYAFYRRYAAWRQEVDLDNEPSF